MKVALINGSPKVKDSSSDLLLAEMQRRLGSGFTTEQFNLSRPQVEPEIVGAICKCDVLLLAFPLYVDAVPSHLLRWLVALQARYQSSEPGLAHGAMVYVMVNCGFYEASQNRLAVEIMRNWCRRCQLIWGQGVGIGGGGMVSMISRIPAGSGPLKNLGSSLATLTDNLRQGKTGDTLFADPNFPRAAYRFFAHRGWRTAARANGLKVKDLTRQL